MRNNRITRRSVLRSAACAAAFSIIPARVLGKEAPSNTIQLAMFGVGERGSGVMRGFAAETDARFIIVCDPFKSRREAAAKRLGETYKDTPPATTADYREVMSRQDIDACIICTCDHWHIPLAYFAAISGKDCYVEKPLGPSLQWACRLRDAMKRHGRIMQYGTQQRSSASFRYAAEVALNGYLGRIKHVDTWCIDGTRAREWLEPASLVAEPVPADLDYDLWLGPAAYSPYSHFRVHREGSFHCYDHSIGFIAGWGAHPLDIAQWGLNRDHSGPVEYSGTGWIPKAGLYSTVCGWDVRCRYDDGVTMHFMEESVARSAVKYRKRWSDHGTTFFGEEGWISVDRGGVEASDPKLFSLKLKPTDTHLLHSPGHDRNFLDCIRTRRQPISPLEAAIRSDTISHLSEIAIRLGRTVRWDPAREQPVNDDQVARMLGRAMRPPYQM